MWDARIFSCKFHRFCYDPHLTTCWSRFLARVTLLSASCGLWPFISAALQLRAIFEKGISMMQLCRLVLSVSVLAAGLNLSACPLDIEPLSPTVLSVAVRSCTQNEIL